MLGIMNGRLVIVISTLMILGASSIASQNAFAQTGTDDHKLTTIDPNQKEFHIQRDTFFSEKQSGEYFEFATW